MDIKDYLAVLWRRKWIVVVTTAVAVAAAAAGTRLMRPVYQATTTLRVAASAGGSLNYTASTYSSQLLNTTAQIASSRPMLDELVTRLKLVEPPVVTAVVVPSTELIKITVEYSNPVTVALIANTLADMLIIQSNQLYTGGQVPVQDFLAQQVAEYKADLDRTRREYDMLLAATPTAPEQLALTLDTLQLKERTYESLLLQYNEALLQEEVRSNMMTVVEKAIPPEAPARPQILYNYSVGLVLGLLVGVVLAFTVENFDPTLHGIEEVERAADLPVMAEIPTAAPGKLRISPGDTTPLAEGFRNLATHVILSDRERHRPVWLIMSAEPQQGKSMVASNLAIALVEYGKNIVLVDCDMRRPRLHDLFDLPNDTGLSDILADASDIKTELRHPFKHISVITSGKRPLNPSLLLSSPHMVELIRDLRREFDFVLLDTPSWLVVPDTSAIVQNPELAENLDALLLVVRRSHAARDPVQAACKFVSRFPDKRGGIVLTQARSSSAYYHYVPQDLPKPTAGRRRSIKAK